jgi:hypothetical protein
MKLEKRLIKSFKTLKELIEGRRTCSIVRFYSEYHHYQRLDRKHFDLRGEYFNPIRYMEGRK